MKKIKDFFLKAMVNAQLDPNVQRGSKYVQLGMVMLLLGSSPIFAQTGSSGIDINDNIIVKGIWWLTRILFYGTGAVVTLLGLFLPLAKKVLSSGHRMQEMGAIPTMLTGVTIFLIPSLLKMFMDWISQNSSSPGLDNMYLELDGFPNGGGN